MWLSILAFPQLCSAVGSIRSLGSVWYMHLKAENCSLGCVWFNVKYFSENKYFPEMLFSGKENIFKCLVAL